MTLDLPTSTIRLPITSMPPALTPSCPNCGVWGGSFVSCPEGVRCFYCAPRLVSPPEPVTDRGYW
jgi:hypothetical protein